MPKINEVIGTCKTCIYSLKEGENLFCHRNPPAAQLIPIPSGKILQGSNQQQQVNLTPVSVFPPVQENNFCGEFLDESEIPEKNELN